MTAQVPDTLSLEGRNFSLCTNPLEEYFDEDRPRPNFIPLTTADWRGYMARWEIHESRFFLAELRGNLCVKPTEEGGRISSWCQGGHKGECDIKRVGLSDLFATPSGPVFAEWYSGELCVPHGKMTQYVHMGYASSFERYLLIAIDRGNVTGTRIVGEEARDRELLQGRSERDNARKTWWRFWK